MLKLNATELRHQFDQSKIDWAAKYAIHQGVEPEHRLENLLIMDTVRKTDVEVVPEIVTNEMIEPGK